MSFWVGFLMGATLGMLLGTVMQQWVYYKERTKQTGPPRPRPTPKPRPTEKPPKPVEPEIRVIREDHVPKAIRPRRAKP